MAELFTIEAAFTLLMLIMLQAVLGFDNLLYIATESNKVGNPEDARKVRTWGIAIAVILRIVLLVLIVGLFDVMAKYSFGVNLGSFLQGDMTVQAVITLFGGAFIIYTAIKEINHLLAVEHIEHSEGSGRRTVGKAIALIVMMNLVFSFDSILSAMAIASVPGVDGGPTTYQVPLMAIAIILSGVAMIFGKEKSQFRPFKAKSILRLDNTALAGPVGKKAGRNVDGNNGGRSLIEVLNQLGPVAFYRSVEARTKQGIDDQRIGRQGRKIIPFANRDNGNTGNGF